jgi:hypothetical protein
MLGKIGAWLAGLVALAAIVAVGFLIFEGISRMPGDHTVKPAALQEASFRRCPAVVTTPPRAADQPVDDLGGLRPGLTREDARNILACMAGDFSIRIEPRAFELPAKARQLHDELYAGKDGLTWLLGLFVAQGGTETVGTVRREATFSPARAPLIADVEADILRHFGPSHESHSLPGGGRQMTWTYLKSGKRVRTPPVEGSPSYLIDLAAYIGAGFQQADCAKNAQLAFDAPPTFDIRCGVTIRAAIDASPSDRLRAWRVRQVIVDQQRLAAALAGT